MGQLKLSATNASRMEALQKKFESKGLRKKDWSEIMNAALQAIPDATIEKMVDQHVPDDVVLRQLMKDPEMKQKLAEFARRESKRTVKPAAPKSANEERALETPKEMKNEKAEAPKADEPPKKTDPEADSKFSLFGSKKSAPTKAS